MVIAGGGGKQGEGVSVNLWMETGTHVICPESSWDVGMGKGQSFCSSASRWYYKLPLENLYLSLALPSVPKFH